MHLLKAKRLTLPNAAAVVAGHRIRVAGRPRTMAVAALGAAAVLALGTGLAQAKAPGAAPMTGGIVHLYEAGTGTGNIDHDVLTGAFTDYGSDHEGALDHGNVNKIVLTKGSFEANVAALDAKLHPISMNLKTCSVVVNGTAPVPLSHGTGAYRGIHGSIRATVTIALVFKRKNGKCATGPTAPELAGVTLVTGSGRVSF
jgi:hypothetical protein